MRISVGSLVLLAVALVASNGVAGETGFASPPKARKAGGKTVIEFACAAATDVEVAVLDGQGRVVRHLAAGVLGAKNAPPAPLKPGLSQTLEWDGNDDYGAAAAGGPFKARVRAGMGVKLERIVGGDPYAFFSRDTNHGNHAFWYMGGLERKPDGSVYVAGSQNQFGMHTIRRYDADGNYLNTVFPPPAGKPAEQMKGWGLNFNADGSYTPKYGRLESPFMSTTSLCTERLRPIRLIACSDNEKLTVLGQNYELAILNTDGTIESPRSGSVVAKPDFPGGKGNTSPFGPLFTCLSPDGKILYLSGFFAGKTNGSGGTLKAAEEEGFWKEGQVWKVDVANREAKPFFALDKVVASREDRAKSAIGGAFSYSELHGVAADAEGHVFVCDRLNKRVVVLDQEAKILNEIPVSFPDDVVLGVEKGALYVTTRVGEEHIRGGELKLLKIADWRTDANPAIELKLIDNDICYHKLNRSYLLVTKGKDGPNIWVAYKDLPVRIYRDKGASFELLKEFYETGPQRCLSLYHMMADPKTENIYVSDGYHGLFRLTDWNKPELALCYLAKDWGLSVSSFTIDSRNRYLYGRMRGKDPTDPEAKQDQMQGIGRYRLDGEYMSPAPLGNAKSHVLTENIDWNWVISYGNEDHGMGVAPNGQLAAVGSPSPPKGWDFAARLLFFKGDCEHLPWKAMQLTAFGTPKLAGGVRFDAQGNLYVGVYDGKPNNIPKGFAGDRLVERNLLRIHKYAPTGSLAQGDLFPTQPKGPAKVYDVHFGAFGDGKFRRSALFGVDGYGRIYYPTSLSQTVSVIDNESNEILHFGTYGNRDSMGGLEGDLVPTKDIPMAYPNSVDATDDFIYVADLVNVRLLRIAKTFAASETAEIK